MHRPTWLPILPATLLVAAAPVAGQVAAPAVAAADEAAIDALVRRIYGRYQADRLAPLARAAIYTPDTLALIRENARLLHGGIGAIDGDVFIDAQDFGRISVDAVALSPRPDGRVDAAVRFSDPANDVRGKVVTLIVARVARVAGGWRVHDVMLPASGSLRGALVAENRRLQRRR